MPQIFNSPKKDQLYRFFGQRFHKPQIRPRATPLPNVAHHVHVLISHLSHQELLETANKAAKQMIAVPSHTTGHLGKFPALFLAIPALQEIQISIRDRAERNWHFKLN